MDKNTLKAIKKLGEFTSSVSALVACVVHQEKEIKRLKAEVKKAMARKRD